MISRTGRARQPCSYFLSVVELDDDAGAEDSLLFEEESELLASEDFESDDFESEDSDFESPESRFLDAPPLPFA
jgi:hypothetical protein